MDINQLLELWSGLSPHLIRAATKLELPDDQHASERKDEIGVKCEMLYAAQNDYEEDAA